jgi:ferredoxin
MECPNEAVYAGSNKNEINPLRCTECVGHYDEPQCKRACPVNCIIQDPDVVESKEMLLIKFERMHQSSS